MMIYLEIAIALIVVFLLLSLATTAVNEAIASLLKTRARQLAGTLRVMITDKDVRKAFYAHPLIATFRPRRDANGNALATAQQDTRHPSYLPSACFGKALFHAILTAQTQEPNASVRATVGSFRQAAAKIENPAMKDAILALIDSASDSLEDVQRAFETWFDAAMDQLSGRFKRFQQVISFVIAFGLAAAINLNVFALSAELAENDALRLVYVEMAQDFAATLPPEDTDPQNPDETPETENAACPPAREAQEGAAAPVQTCLPTSLAEIYRQAQNLGVGPRDHNGTWSYELLSYLIAALAAVLGAPFWFDLLKRFVNIRGAGIRPPGAP